MLVNDIFRRVAGGGQTDEHTPAAVAFLQDTKDVNEIEIMRARMRGSLIFRQIFTRPGGSRAGFYVF